MRVILLKSKVEVLPPPHQQVLKNEICFTMGSIFNWGEGLHLNWAKCFESKMQRAQMVRKNSNPVTDVDIKSTREARVSLLCIPSTFLIRR